MLPTTSIYVLKRSNGLFGVYVNGKQQAHLKSNSSLTMPAEYLIDTVLREMKKVVGAVFVYFTDDESEFQNDLPKLEDIIKQYE
jgi:hypothetical protein